jgi:hypothetical protein
VEFMQGGTMVSLLTKDRKLEMSRAKSNPPLAATIAVLQGAGVPFTIELGGKHIKVVWRHIKSAAYGGLLIVSKSASDNHAAQDAASTAKRQLRLAGSLT